MEQIAEDWHPPPPVTEGEEHPGNSQLPVEFSSGNYNSHESKGFFLHKLKLEKRLKIVNKASTSSYKHGQLL